MNFTGIFRLARVMGLTILTLPVVSAARPQNPDSNSQPVRSQRQRLALNTGDAAALERPSKPPDAPKPPAPAPGNSPSSPGHPSKPPGRPTPPRPAPGKAPHPPVRPGRPHAGTHPYMGSPRPYYHFEPRDRDRIRRYYSRDFGYINRWRRPRFVIGAYVPFGYRGYFRPIPSALLGYLPAPPPGCQLGYFDGYVVVYDATTFAILSVIDLLD